ncbi:MAG: dihydroorotase [Bacteroidetes bacterium]|jgi:dihydroorotase|nr:dihydroorotase [Bacteroidota bacterium]MBK7039352.1 dihydroorotase [Bacteroidota bacterium]MBK7588242.1 dihydroorotase [Bacteroidota bacterium]MBK9480774.1 dihydroorotase [Bacteroidota bacterium]
MSTLIFKNVHVVNEGNIEVNDVLIKNNHFEKVAPTIDVKEKAVEIDGTGMHLMPGLIDDQVHFREPGLTHKASIYTEAKAAVAGGVTSFMEMPNVKPPTLTHALLEEKYLIGQHHSVANYSFFMGVSNDNIEEALKINRHKKEVCGLKIFMGSSTGNMLVDNIITLEKIFAESEVLIATHCEQENIISQHIEQLKAQHVDYNHVSFHPIIRDVEACYESSLSAIQLAKKHHTRLHILHISTEKELQLFTNLFPLKDKRITAEVCVHHLHFTADDYAQYGNLIKCNPAIKAKENREALWQALLDDRLDIIATDHAPHTWDEKQQDYVSAPAGVPLVQHSLYLLLEAYKAGKISLEKIVEKACHAPAICFEIEKRGYIREGYFADAVLVNLNEKYTVTKENILYKCGWSPFEGHTFPALIHKTIVNGHVVYDQGVINEQSKGMRLRFDRN